MPSVADRLPERARLRDWLPRGRTLPAAEWERRHRVIVCVLWAHLPLLVAFGVATGHSLVHSVLDLGPVIPFAVAASTSMLPRRARSAMAALGLLTCSALIVHLWAGRIEAHFHFFVIVALLATYEEWFVYGLAMLYVVVHHGLAGGLAPGSVFDHASAIDHPWRWAGIHGLFITALGLTNVLTWRLNEIGREATRVNRQRFQSAFDDAPIGMALVGLDGHILRANAALAANSGYDAAELQGMALQTLLPEDDRSDGPWPSEGGEVERRFRRSDDTVGWALWQHSLVTDAAGRPEHWVTHCLDISRRKRAERQLDYQAHHDALTGLPNRTRFVATMREWLADERGLAVVFVDLDNFKLINDSLGHAAGDRLLVTVAERLRRVLRPDDVIARFGGDEFAVGMRGVADERAARWVADRLAAALRPPVELDGHARFVTASFGVRWMPAGTGDPEALLRDADAAMYRAKELGKARCELFDASMHERAVERLDLEGGLRQALDRDELRLVYQPQIDLATGRMIGVEALVRWEHPERGTVPPQAFVPLAEQTGLIVPIGAWVLREACRQTAEWAADGSPLGVSVNISPRQLAETDFAAVVTEALTDCGLEPGQLSLEITESALMADPEAAAVALQRLKAIGVRLAIDDFGTGYSSLGQLRSLLPVDTLKIDKSFVGGMTIGGEDQAIVEAVLRLAASLGLQAVAEGVETAEQAGALRELECGVAQGFHFARPVAPSAVTRLLQQSELGELAG
jgi:diguanylate cyclase (GGDEF)-like protein/PAS domain S-box-containing protein